MDIPPEKPMAIESEVDGVDMARFDLDKTYTAWFECQKKWAASVNLFVIVTTTLAVSVFADEPKDGFTVPFVGLSLKKWYAVELLTVIQVASFYRFVAMSKYQKVVNLKFRKVLERLGDSCYHWHWQYPSVSGFSASAEEFHERYVIIYYATVGILFVGGFLFPVFCLYIAFTALSYTVDLCISGVACVAVLFLSGLVIWGPDDESSLQRLDSPPGANSD